MKKVIVGTYRKDTLYPKVVRATAELLKESDEVSPVAILMKIGNLTPQDHEAWRRGRIPYLERAFQGSLSKAARYLRIIGFHAHDLNMVPHHHTYRQTGKKRILRFSRSNDPNVEKSYARHFRWNQSPEKKQMMVEKTLSEQVDGEGLGSAGASPSPSSYTFAHTGQHRQKHRNSNAFVAPKPN